MNPEIKEAKIIAPVEFLEELSDEALEKVVGGQSRAIIQSPDGTVTQTQPGDVATLTGGQLQITTFPVNPFK